MNEKDRFDANVQIANIAFGRWDARRQYEWRVTLALWAALVAAIISFRAQVLPMWIGALLLALYANWLQSLWRRHSKDANLGWTYLNKAIAVVDGAYKHDEEAQRLRIGESAFRRTAGFFSDWAIRFQFVCTAGLVATVYACCAKSTPWFGLVSGVQTIKP